jgi:hypothetical protein
MKTMSSAALAAAVLLCNASGRAEEDTALAGRMNGVKVTLEQGLAASSSKGTAPTIRR